MIFVCEYCSILMHGMVQLGHGPCGVCVAFATMNKPGRCNELDCPWYGAFFACEHGHANDKPANFPKYGDLTTSAEHAALKDRDSVARRLLSSVWPE